MTAQRSSAVSLILILLVALLDLHFVSSLAHESGEENTMSAPAERQARSGRLRLAFTDEYRCSGAAFDDPQRMRIKCQRAPARTADCRCSFGPGGAFAKSLSCACEPGPEGASATPSAAIRSFFPAMGTVESVGLIEPTEYL